MLTAVDPDYRMVVYDVGQLMVSQSLPKGYYATVGLVYLGLTHLDQTSLPNSLPPGSTLPINGPLSGYIYEESNGKLRAIEETYQFGRNMANGLSASVYGQTVRAVDDGAVGAFGGSGNIAQNWLEPEFRKGDLHSIRPRKASFNGNWQYSTSPRQSP